MTCFRPALRCAIGILLCLAMSGCFPGGDSLDEQKEPHFLTGKSLVNQLDYPGAIESFEKALEVNPRSASAHFELGCLYSEKENDPAAAIYHYQRYLKLRPKSENADLVRQLINRCITELARNVPSLGTLPPGAQHDLDRLMTENKQLKEKLAEWEAVAARYQALTNPPVTNPPANPPPPRQNAEPIHVENNHSNPLRAVGSMNQNNRPTHPATLRTHTVKPGQTFAAIARQYGVSVNVLMAANPQVRPTHLPVGSTLNIPSP
ncbi:MAG: peptidoglycan-binding protein [Pedosphaera sp.]|nr:peptidoglycan-binding protein [Pedosphaera sp.]